MKIKYIILFILALLIGGGLLLYHNTFGFGAKKKYDNCLKACEKIIINESNIPACKIRCEEITGYSPTKKTPSPTSKNNITTPSTGDSVNNVYACKWSWPQKVIDKNTKKVVKVCPRTRPWCHSTDLSKDGAGCCGNVIKSTREYIDCKTLSEL